MIQKFAVEIRNPDVIAIGLYFSRSIKCRGIHRKLNLKISLSRAGIGDGDDLAVEPGIVKPIRHGCFRFLEKDKIARDERSDENEHGNDFFDVFFHLVLLIRELGEIAKRREIRGISISPFSLISPITQISRFNTRDTLFSSDKALPSNRPLSYACLSKK